MDSKIEELKQVVIRESNNKNFIHSPWFVKYHLDVIEQITNELCDIYKDADRNIVNILVWLHDYGKILAGQPEDFDQGDELAIVEGRKLLEKIGFDNSVIDKTMEYLDLINRKMEIDLNNAPIEVKILSSSDAAAHFIGPFFQLYWHENPDKTIEELCAANIKKAEKDWNRKVVLPEIREKFQPRYDWIMESLGNFEKKYF